MNNMNEIKPIFSTKGSSDNSSRRLEFEPRLSKLDFGTNTTSSPPKVVSRLSRTTCSHSCISNMKIECVSFDEDTHDRTDALTGYEHNDDYPLMTDVCIDESRSHMEVFIEGLDLIDRRLSELHCQDDDESYHSIAQDSLDVMKRRMEKKVESNMPTLRDFRRRFTTVSLTGSALDPNVSGPP